jgi:hypothetical protein
MLSLIFGFFSDLLYWVALGAMFGGMIAYILSYAVKILPMLGGYGLILQVAGVLLTISGGAYVSDHHGYERRVAEDKAEIERLNAEARAKEVELGNKLAKANNQLIQAKNAIQSKQFITNRRIDAGELRFPSTCGVQADSGATAGDGAHGPDAERQALKDIVQIAADGDAAIVSLNSCIDRYEQVRQTVNEGVK